MPAAADVARTTTLIMFLTGVGSVMSFGIPLFGPLVVKFGIDRWE